MLNNLINTLPEKIKTSELFSEDGNAASFQDTEGVVISRNEAKYILKLLKTLRRLRWIFGK